jgi:hypothetical protein
MVGDLEVSPLFPPIGTVCPPSPSLPWVAWASLPHLLRYYARLRLPRALLGSLRFRSLPNTLAAPSVCVPSAGSLAAGSCLPTPGLLVSRYPCSSGVRYPGDTWLSQVPEFPLWLHALLLDPGGILRTSPWRTQDCCLPLVPQRQLSLANCRQGYPCGPRLYTFRGSIPRPEVLLPPAPYSPHGACTRSSLLSCWLGFAQMGLEPHGLSPTGEH